MSLSRTHNSIVNVSWGLIVTLLNTLVTFANRTVFVKCLGPEYLGLNSLFSEVITMLSLAELGVGMAINFSLYRPIHDYVKLSQLMSLYKKTYNIIAFVIFALGLIVLPFVHLIVNGTNFSLGFIRLVFFLFILNTACSYLLSYNQSYINANQKQYVVSLVSVIVKVLFTVLLIILLLLTHNYILYVICVIIQTLVTNIILTIYVRRKYPFLDYSEKLPKNERRKIFVDIKNIFIKRVSGILTSNSANVFISLFVSTVQVGLYSNYVLLLSVFKSLNTQLSTGIKASIGDLMASGDSERCVVILRRLTFMFYIFAFFSCSALLTVSSDFIEIWLGKEYVLGSTIVFIIVLNLFLSISFEPLWQYLEVSGLFRQDRDIAIIGSILNIAIVIVFGYYIGMAGILLGSVISQVAQMLLKAKILYKLKFEKSCSSFLLMIIKMTFTFVIFCVFYFLLIDYLNLDKVFVSIFFKLLFSLVMTIFLLLFVFGKSNEFHYCKVSLLSCISSIIKKYR